MICPGIFVEGLRDPKSVWINNGMGKVWMGVDPSPNVVRAKPVTGTICCATLIVAYDTVNRVCIFASRLVESAVTAELLCNATVATTVSRRSMDVFCSSNAPSV